MPDIEVEQLMARVRVGIRRQGNVEEDPPSDMRGSSFNNDQVDVDLADLRLVRDVREISFASHRRVFGPLVRAAKQILHKLLTPVLERQATYNVTSARLTAHLIEWVRALERQHAQALHAAGNQADILKLCQAQLRSHGREVEALREQLLDRGHTVDALREELRDRGVTIEALREELRERGRQLQAFREEFLALDARLRQELVTSESRQQEEGKLLELRLHEAMAVQSQESVAAVRERIAGVERKIRRILYALQMAKPAASGSEPIVATAPEMLEALTSEFDYAGFEERFRGSEECIRERQEGYVRFFEGRDNVLDIGCGRGEFLELLGARGVEARGVDLCLDMVLLCRDKKLDVVMEDAFTYLKALPDDSLGGVFAAQVIEHLPPRRVIELVSLCHRKLEPGAALLLETPNPTCLAVFSDSFYRDPTHLQPIHPDTLHFLFEAAGFCEVEVAFSTPVDASMKVPPLDVPGVDVEEFNQGIERLNTVLFGYQDYAVVGRKGS